MHDTFYHCPLVSQTYKAHHIPHRTLQSTMSAHTPAQLSEIVTHEPIPNAEKIIAFLSSHSITKADRKVLATFLKAAKAVAALPAYKAMTDADAAEKHCVRCHTSFSDDDNDSDACTIPHVFDPEGMDVFHPSECCGERVQLEAEEHGSEYYTNLHEIGLCFEGSHTTDVSEVRDQRNGVNIFPCEIGVKSGRCIRLRVDEEDPVASWHFRLRMVSAPRFPIPCLY